MVWFVVVLSQYVYNSFGITPVVPTWRHRFGVSRSERRGCSRRHTELPSQVPARERHPASDLQESHPPLSRTCVRSLRYWLSQARFSGFRPIVSGPASYSCFSFSFLPGHAFCLSAFRRVPYFAPFLALYRPYSPLPFPFPFLFPPRYLSPFRSCTCCSTNPRPYSILSRGLLPAPLPSVTIRRRVSNRRDEAMAAAQGRGHVV